MRSRLGAATVMLTASLLIVCGCSARMGPGQVVEPKVLVGGATGQRSQEAYRLRREAAIAKARMTDDLESAQQALASALTDPLFPTLSATDQRDLVSAAAWVEVRSGRYDAAASHYRQAVKLDPGDPDDWHRLSMSEEIVGNYEASVDALIRVLLGWPEFTDALSAGNVLSLVDHQPIGSEKRLELMQTLFDADWKREEEPASELWYELALTRIERGELDLARIAIGKVRWPSALIRMQADRRFDGIVVPGNGLVAVALRDLIDRLELLSRNNPRNLYTHNAWLKALLYAGRFEEVVDISDELLARIVAESPEDPAFHDSDDRNVTLELRATALRRLKRLDEAEAALREASALAEFGEQNISQKLDLAHWYCARLRPDEAVATLGEFSAMAEQNQRSERDLILMRAALMRQDTNEAEAYLKRILAQVDGHESRATRALVWAGKLDAAAELFIRRLSDPRLRGNALLVAQIRRESVPLPGDALYHARWRALLERVDVQAAINAVGRVQSYAVW